MKELPRGHPHSAYAQKSPKLNPLPLNAIVRFFLYIMINASVIASFVQKTKSFEICGVKIFLAVRTQP